LYSQVLNETHERSYVDFRFEKIYKVFNFQKCQHRHQALLFQEDLAKFAREQEQESIRDYEQIIEHAYVDLIQI